MHKENFMIEDDKNEVNENDEFAIFEDPKFFRDLTEEIWKENFEKVGYIYIGVGDEPEGCTSRVYQDKHREFVGLDANHEIEVRSNAPDYDWEKALYEPDNKF